MTEKGSKPQRVSVTGRPRVSDPKTRFVAVRVTPEQHAALSVRAAKVGLSVGAYLRTMGLGDTGPRAVRQSPIELGELARALALLGKYGGNLNQLAHAANASGSMPTAAELATLRAEVQEIRAALMRALGRGD